MNLTIGKCCIWREAVRQASYQCVRDRCKVSWIGVMETRHSYDD